MNFLNESKIPKTGKKKPFTNNLKKHFKWKCMEVQQNMHTPILLLVSHNIYFSYLKCTYSILKNNIQQKKNSANDDTKTEKPTSL